jgi:small subunit ribosomal protein S17
MAYSKKQKAKKDCKNIGIDAALPAGRCTDKNCPWHGNLSLRGRQFTGKVISAKAPKTAIIEWEFVHFIPKYERYERRHSRLSAFNPECIAAKKGDTVRVSECRPISKTKSFAVIEIIGGNKQ